MQGTPYGSVMRCTSYDALSLPVRAIAVFSSIMVTVTALAEFEVKFADSG
jgi:hypothetical protein